MRKCGLANNIATSKHLKEVCPYDKQIFAIPQWQNKCETLSGL